MGRRATWNMLCCIAATALLPANLASQTGFKTIEVAPRFGFYQMAERDWTPLTLHLTAADLVLSRTPRQTWYLGPRIASNFLGVRAGYISLGGHFGLQHSLRGPWALRAEVDANAGGGGFAQDGDGWVLGGTVSLMYRRNTNLELGLCYHYASEGLIQGASPYLGWSTPISLLSKITTEDPKPGGFRPLRLFVGGFVQPSFGKQPYGDPEGTRTYPFTMFGVELRAQRPRWEQGLSLSAAADTFGGYMLVQTSLTPRIFTSSTASINPQILFGAGGGGRSIHYYGGLHYGVGLEGQLSLGSLGRAVASTQWIRTNGPWNYRAYQVGIQLPMVLARVADPTVGHDLQLRQRPINLRLGVKGYRSDSLWAACFGGELMLAQRGSYSVSGSTWWAALGGNLGAYAEGLIHVQAKLLPHLRFVATAGLGAGGGINHLGNTYLYGAGFEAGSKTILRAEVWTGAPSVLSLSIMHPFSIPLVRVVN